MSTGAQDERNRFHGRVALITGGTSGIGLQIARQFVLAGASVALVGTDTERGTEAERQIKALVGSPTVEVVFYAANVAEKSELNELMLRLIQRFGQLDYLVVAAGIGRKASLLDTSPEDLSRLFQVNLLGAIMTVQEASPHLTESRGSVVLISSDAGVLGEAHAGAYSVSKAGLNMAGKMLAIDLAKVGVRVNVIAPGDVVPGMRTMTRPEEPVRSGEDYLSWAVPPLGRYGEPEDVAQAVLFLCSPAASFITGSVLLVDGGMRAGLRFV